MPLTLTLPPQVEQRLRERADRAGVAPDEYVAELVGRDMAEAHPAVTADNTFDEILAPFRAEVEASGATDDELYAYFYALREEVRRERAANQAD